ncbi:prephenate dehydratase [Pendulispora brunnea]|uniref:Bifunctional chorismate mutase/prephenate dehydratase n=1 Tax=Pendulispora brunnea TaxID=2905690 RepID=A0ABZ2KRP9_9BACT
MSIESLRAQIDATDERILELLNERASLAVAIGHAKRAAHTAANKEGAEKLLRDPERERAVLDRLSALAKGQFPQHAVRAVFREVMSGCLSLEQPLHVAFLGPEGTFTQMAARYLFGLSAQYREAATIEGVFDAVRTGDAALGVVAIENSTEGSVTLTADLLIEGNVVVREELVLLIEHALLARDSVPFSSVQRVYSHPQALAQCRGWLTKNLPGAQLVQTASTTAAARQALLDTAGAAVASPLAAELHGLTILRERIQDRTENATRFVVLGKEDAPRTGRDRTSLAFSVKDERGALRRVLSAFEEEGVNLSRLESRPSQQKPWDYVFLVDLEGHRTDDNVQRALENLRSACDMVKVLGSYARRDPIRLTSIP